MKESNTKGPSDIIIIPNEPVISDVIIVSEITRKQFTLIDKNVRELKSETLKEKIEANELELGKIDLVRGNNTKHMNYKNSVKRRVLDNIVDNAEPELVLASMLAVLIPRTEIINGRGCQFQPPLAIGQEGVFKIYYTYLIGGDYQSYTFFNDSKGLIPFNWSAIASNTLILNSYCFGLNTNLGNQTQFYQVNVF